jgi:hypothetical protein
LASNTPNLNLYKADPATEGENTFNIKTMMNDNWDKIDSTVAKKTDIPTIPSNLPANGGNSTTVNNHTAAITPGTTEKIDLVGMVNEVKDEVDTHKADYVAQPANGGTTSGSSTAYTITTNPAATSLIDKIGVVFTVHADSGINPTLQWGSLAAKPIKKPNGNSAVLKNGGIYTVRYNATSGNFILQGEGASGNATASDLLSGKTASTDAGDIIGTLDLSNLTTSNIRKGVTINGITGNALEYGLNDLVPTTAIDTTIQYQSVTSKMNLNGTIVQIRACVNTHYDNRGGNRLILVATTTTVYKINVSTLSIIWSKALSVNNIYDMDYKNCNASGIVVLANTNSGNILYKLDPSTGNIVYSVTMPNTNYNKFVLLQGSDANTTDIIAVISLADKYINVYRLSDLTKTASFAMTCFSSCNPQYIVGGNNYFAIVGQYWANINYAGAMGVFNSSGNYTNESWSSPYYLADLFDIGGNTIYGNLGSSGTYMYLGPYTNPTISNPYYYYGNSGTLQKILYTTTPPILYQSGAPYYRIFKDSSVSPVAPPTPDIQLLQDLGRIFDIVDNISLIVAFGKGSTLYATDFIGYKITA